MTNEAATNPEKKKKRRGVVIPFLILSIVGNGILAWLWLRERDRADTVVVLKEQVIVERDNVMADLVQLKEEYATLQTGNTELQSELEAKRAEIDVLIEEAKKHKNDSYIISKLRKETETLRAIMKHYIVEIDSLNTLNKSIIVEKNKISEHLNTEISKGNQLKKDKNDLEQTVSLGSVLKAMSPTAIGVRFRGGTKEIETSKASRIERIKVSFALSENRIAKKGVKPVYVHIMAPNGKEVAQSESEDNIVSFNGTKGLFAEKKEVNYTNIELPVDIFCSSPTGFVPGKYLIDVICDGTIIGQTAVTLK